METVDLGIFDCRRGDAFTLPILGEEDADGALVNLALYGSEWTSQIRKRASDTAPATSFVVDAANIAGAVDPGHDAPQLVLTLTDAQTTALDSGLWAFDVQVTGGALTPFTPYSGQLRITRDITRA